MELRISELKIRPDHTKQELEREIRKALRLRGELPPYEIMRRSVDARKKPDIFYVYTVDVKTPAPKEILKRCRNKKVTLIEKKTYRFPYKNIAVTDNARPVIVGSGPAGLFCALMLARVGMRPIILERGEAVEQRIESVQRFWETGRLDPQSNVQFGEGGAGTFSDGKLNTLIKDPDGMIRFVLQEFVRAGADSSILYDHKPHIGTDILVQVVRSMREEIESFGGEYRFGSCLTDICVLPDAYEIKSETETEKVRNGQNIQCVASARFSLGINGVSDALRCNSLVLAIGHSARDTFEMLYQKGFVMQPKPFAVGLRMEHRQQTINDAMYGRDCPYEMGAAPYKVTHKYQDGRGVYSFCMCPGGYVVNASSEEGRTAVNGMSYHDRAGENANSAIVVTVSPQDYGSEHPLSGIAFQRSLEEKAYRCGDGKIPVQRYADFIAHTETKGFGTVRPSMKGAYQTADLRDLLPEALNLAIIEGVAAFGRKISGFDDPDALLSGVESRTSSPVRIVRNDKGMANVIGNSSSVEMEHTAGMAEKAEGMTAVAGLFPCGEGAGYAGGITSAAVDGIRVAQWVCRAEL